MTNAHDSFFSSHHLQAYILPDNRELDDHGTLTDIRSLLRPTFTEELLTRLDGNAVPQQDLHGRLFLPGYVGLNNIKANDYVNVVLQALAHIRPLRNHLLLAYRGDAGLAVAFRELLEKMWNPALFKAQTSPHEFLQAVSNASNKRFSLTTQSDPLDFLVWLLHSLAPHVPLASDLFQGRIRVDSCHFDAANGGGAHPATHPTTPTGTRMNTTVKPFFFLTLDLPPTPLFLDPRNPTAIPQVALATLLEKYNGGTFTYRQNEAFAYSIATHPQHLILRINRFIKTSFATEKNPTIVSFVPDGVPFPVDPHAMSDDAPSHVHYNLLANIYCTGSLASRSFGVHLRCPATGTWLDIDNLSVRETQPQMLFMAESYLQIWERADAA